MSSTHGATVVVPRMDGLIGRMKAGNEQMEISLYIYIYILMNSFFVRLFYLSY